MKLHLAGVGTIRSAVKKVNLGLIETSDNSCISEAQMYKDTFILESFYYANEFTEQVIIPNCKDFLLDSGAFTFVYGTKKEIDWNDYIKRYTDFINKNQIKKYFELDIDNIVGYDTVIEIRKKLEKLTGIKPIPVWHPSRGLKDFEETTKEYPYVALGGIAGAKKGSKQVKIYEKNFNQFINIAHSNGAKIHGLGYTSLTGLKKYHFDSVDSTSWLAGNKYGMVYWFDGKTLQKIDKKPGQRVKTNQVILHNFNEWKKFSQYAERNL